MVLYSLLTLVLSGVQRVLKIKFPIIGDTHLPEGPEPLAVFCELLLEVKAAKPDLVLLVGDYIFDPKSEQLPAQRENFINVMKLVDPIPRAKVLGNYESWSNVDECLAEFDRLAVDVMQNEVNVLEIAKGPVCVRGLGDKFISRFGYVDYPDECMSIPRLTITHDPAGAFNRRAKGVNNSRANFIVGRSVWRLQAPCGSPTDTPSFAHCGLYEAEEMTVFVTSAVGIAVLPLRYGAHSHWDMLELSWLEK